MASGRSSGPPSGGRRSSGGASGGNRSGGRGSTPAPNRGGGRSAPNRGKNPVGGARRRQPTMRHRQIPWLAIGAVAVLVVLIAGIGFFLFRTNEEVVARDGALAPFRPTSDNQDPATQIPGIDVRNYEAQLHIQTPTRVDYDHYPPSGGPHDFVWAACTSTVYDVPVRNENMVHSLEHGAVWIAYDPERIQGPALTSLQDRVRAQSYLMISPYPGLDQPISLQSWGRQLKLTDAADPRIDQFITALRVNPYTHPEVGASCDAFPGEFDPADPPPFDPTPPGPDAARMDGSNIQSTGGTG